MNIEDIYKDREVQRDELIRNLAIGSIGMIPIAGGVLSLFLDKYLPSTLQKRREDFLNSIVRDMESLPDNTVERLLESDEYHTLLIKTFRSVLLENKKEKINCFRNILLNAAVCEFIPNEVDFYLKLLQELSIDQVRILRLIYLKDCKKEIAFKNINQYIDNNWSEVDKSYRFALVTELMRFGIIKYDEQNNGEHRLNPFGERFIKFIFSPIEE